MLPWDPDSRNWDWQIWWIDTKADPKDLRRLGAWGFRTPDKVPPDYHRLLFKVRSLDDADELSVAKQVQALCWAAFKRAGTQRRNGKKRAYANIIIVIDEYVSVIVSKRSAGAGLLEVFQRGGGKHVGLMGGTQEPVDIPRQLVSQATMIFLFMLTHPPDIEWASKICPRYAVQGPEGLEPNIPDAHGFWFKWVDGPPEFRRWLYFKSISHFRAIIINRTSASLRAAAVESSTNERVKEPV